MTQLLHELVDYGIDLLDKCGQYGGSLSDLVVTGHFFGHLVNGVKQGDGSLFDNTLLAL